MAKSKEPDKKANADTQDANRNAKPNRMFEDGKDIPEKTQSQTLDKNPGKVQPGHRDREQI